MKNPIFLFFIFYAIVCIIIFIDGITKFSTLPTYQFMLNFVNVIMAFIGLIISRTDIKL